jgi:hypothetical protein
VDKRRPRLTIEVNTGDAPMTIESAGGRVSVVPGRHASPDVVLSGPPDGVVGLLAGRIGRADAIKRGVTITGDTRKLSALRPISAPGRAQATRLAGINEPARS